MSREKQIKELAEITSRDCGNCSECEYVGIKNDGVDCIDYFFANTIYNAGYRKQREGKWKFHKDGSGTCDQCGTTQKNVWDYDNWQNYCGHCGANMKGGE